MEKTPDNLIHKALDELPGAGRDLTPTILTVYGLDPDMRKAEPWDPAEPLADFPAHWQPAIKAAAVQLGDRDAAEDAARSTAVDSLAKVAAGTLAPEHLDHDWHANFTAQTGLDAAGTAGEQPVMVQGTVSRSWPEMAGRQALVVPGLDTPLANPLESSLTPLLGTTAAQGPSWRLLPASTTKQPVPYGPPTPPRRTVQRRPQPAHETLEQTYQRLRLDSEDIQQALQRGEPFAAYAQDIQQISHGLTNLTSWLGAGNDPHARMTQQLANALPPRGTHARKNNVTWLTNAMNAAATSGNTEQAVHIFRRLLDNGETPQPSKAAASALITSGHGSLLNATNTATIGPAPERHTGQTVGSTVGGILGAGIGEFIDPLGGGIPGASIGTGLGSAVGTYVDTKNPGKSALNGV
ncbi:MAG TPA: hypothetical protein VGL77_16840, partial [Armatimonadota bacterium]